MDDSWKTVSLLRRRRPRSRFVRGSVLTLVLLAVLPWFSAELRLDALEPARRWANLQRFAASTTPAPLRQGGGISETIPWISSALRQGGWEAMTRTLGISVAAAVFAGALAVLALPGAARTLAVPDPYGPPRSGPGTAAWAAIRLACRAAIALSRAVPEYILAFLAIGIFGLTALPAVLALGLHNAGILGRLGAELVENTPSAVPAALRSAGANRIQIFLFGHLPLVLPRFLVLFFYRWETCVRDATVVGTLGIGTLGLAIQDSRARGAYDSMLLFVALGSLLVLAGDLLSTATRDALRRGR